MFAKERKDEILKLLNENGKVKTLELSELLNVSEPTIRRDIADLDKKGLLNRTHGGALPISESGIEPSFRDKVDRFSEEKKTIGKIAAGMIKKGKCVILDGGTTTLEIINNIFVEDVTVITNSIDVAEACETKDNIHLILLGGQMRWNTRALVGPVAERTLRSFRADLAFIGVNGLNPEIGPTTQNIVEATTKQAMIEVSKSVYIVTDHSKFFNEEMCVISDFKSISGIITDKGLSNELYQQYTDHGIEIIMK